MWSTLLIIIVAKFGNQKTGTDLEHARRLVDHAPFATTPINTTPSLEVKVCGGCGKNNVAPDKNQYQDRSVLRIVSKSISTKFSLGLQMKSLQLHVEGL